MGTVRQQMIVALRQASMDRRDLSQTLHISEKEVVAHLPHVAKSVAAQGMQWQVRPAVCESCGYTFKDRIRLSPPSKCPRCREARIRGPWFHIASPDA